MHCYVLRWWGGDSPYGIIRAEVRVPDGEGEVLGPPLPGPLLQLSLEERGMGVMGFGGGGAWLSRCFGERSQGVAATTPYLVKQDL